MPDDATIDKRHDNAQPAAKPVPVDLLLYFAAVAEEMSFTRAARRLVIDQSWLSHKIRQLEVALRCTLFVRSTRHIELTEAGRDLLLPVRRLVLAVEEAQRAAETLSQRLESKLRIGALPHSFWNPEKVDIIDTFVLQHPKTIVEVETGTSLDLLERLRRGDLDAAFVCEPFDAASLTLLRVSVDQSCLLIPAEDELASRAEIRIADLQGKHVVMPNERFNPLAIEHLYGPLLAAGAIAAPIPEFQQDVMLQSAFRSRRIAVCNIGAAEMRRPADYVARTLIDHDLTSRKWLARRHHYQAPALEAFWRIAQEVLAVPGN